MMLPSRSAEYTSFIGQRLAYRVRRSSISSCRRWLSRSLSSTIPARTPRAVLAPCRRNAPRFPPLPADWPVAGADPRAGLDQGAVHLLGDVAEGDDECGARMPAPGRRLIRQWNRVSSSTVAQTNSASPSGAPAPGSAGGSSAVAACSRWAPGSTARRGSGPVPALRGWAAA